MLLRIGYKTSLRLIERICIFHKEEKYKKNCAIMVVFIFQKEVITMDFRVIGDTYRYGVRVTAIVVRDGKLLAYKVEDQNHLVGGAILVGEASRKAVAREVKEELGVDCEVEELMFVVENRFDYKGELHHMIEFHYKVTLLGEVPSHTLDEGKYECEWIDLQRLNEYDIRPQYLIKELPLWKSGIKQIEIGLE